MGGYLSTSATSIASTNVGTAGTVAKVEESTNQTSIESKSADLVPVDTDLKTVVESPVKAEDKKPEEVLEKYVEPSGTKVEVAPVEVASSADVTKKNKKKNKNNKHN